MTTIKINNLNSTHSISCLKQQQVHGGGGEVVADILNGYESGKYTARISGSRTHFIDSNGNKVGTVISAGGSNFFVKNGKIDKLDDRKVTASTDIKSALLF